MKTYEEIESKELDRLIDKWAEADGACNKALMMVGKLIDGIENMKWDCDGEVYERLLKIADVLAR